MINQFKTLVLLGVLTAILVGFGGAIAPKYVWVFGAIGVLMNLVSYFFSDKIILAIHRAREVTPQEEPRLHAMVAELAQRAGIPKPRVCVLNQDMPNAFATGRNPKHGVVAVTQGIRRLLSERELRGVLAHEIAHVRNRDILITTVAAIIASLISSIAGVIRWGFIFGGLSRSSDDDDSGSGIATLVLAIVAPIAATIVQLAVSQSREYLADEKGGQLCGDPGALADALERLERGNQLVPATIVAGAPATASLFIVNPLRGSGLLSLFSTHPSTEERVRRLRVQARGTGSL
ncbi:MAG: zinc metalloprotease HtpX [Deltaproteobacteria bacterium]|nr:zinc metalloprotease HtpX [Deltaproteobacteria bacterium]